MQLMWAVLFKNGIWEVLISESTQFGGASVVSSPSTVIESSRAVPRRSTRSSSVLASNCGTDGSAIDLGFVTPDPWSLMTGST